jgi:hypothetical protein
MNEYIAISKNFRKYILLADQHPLAEMNYLYWYSLKATIKLSDSTQFLLKPKGIWNSTIELWKDEEVLLNYKLGWKGVNIKIQSEGIEESYLLKSKGIFSYKYILIDSNKKVLLTIKPKYKWNRFNFDFAIESTEQFEQLNLKESLLLTIVHCINYLIAMKSAAV